MWSRKNTVFVQNKNKKQPKISLKKLVFGCFLVGVTGFDPAASTSQKNTALLKKLHEAGIGVYYLSNIGEQAFGYLTNTHEFFQYMDGGIASYREGLLKPDPAIFELFLERYGKRAQECVFVDDTPVNAEAAASLGFHSVILKNIDDLTDELKKIDELAKIIDA